MPTTLVTGGAGYIGSPRPPPPVTAYEGDIRDMDRVREVALRHDVDSVIHMAGLKAVGESVEQPLRYYDNNVAGTVLMLRALQDTPCRKFVFSSSATVYGAAEK